MRYTLVFVVSLTFEHVLLLRKPDTHKNPLFAGKWTAPGGKVEDWESDKACAIRELEEETGLYIDPCNYRYVLSFLCNCDPTEVEHTVIVFGVMMPLYYMQAGAGSVEEPVRVYEASPSNSVWYLDAMRTMVIERLKQPYA